MSDDKIIPLKNPGAPAPVADALTELLREGAQRMLAAAIEAEVAAFLERFKDEKTADGRQAGGAERSSTDAVHPDRCGSYRGQGAAGARSGEGDPVDLGDFAAVPSAPPEP